MKLAFVLTFTLLKTFVHAVLSGSASITPHDYIGLPPQGLLNNPPACEMPYSTLDLSRIVAVQALNKATDCNKCIKVVNSGNGNYVYALAVDLGGQGLDLSIPSFKALFGQQWDASPATWQETDYSNCKGIYDPNGHPTHVTPVAISGSNKIDRPVSKRPTPSKTISVPTGKPTTSPPKSKPTSKKSPNRKKQKKTPKKSSNKKKSKQSTKKSNKNKESNKANNNKKKKKCTRCKVRHQRHHRHERDSYKYF